MARVVRWYRVGGGFGGDDGAKARGAKRVVGFFESERVDCWVGGCCLFLGLWWEEPEKAARSTYGQK